MAPTLPPIAVDSRHGAGPSIISVVLGVGPILESLAQIIEEELPLHHKPMKPSFPEYSRGMYYGDKGMSPYISEIMKSWKPPQVRGQPHRLGVECEEEAQILTLTDMCLGMALLVPTTTQVLTLSRITYPTGRKGQIRPLSIRQRTLTSTTSMTYSILEDII